MLLETDIFLVTYPGDYPWLPFLFRSIARNVTGWRRVVVVIEMNDDPAPVADALTKAGIHPLWWRIELCRQYRGTPDCSGMTGQQIEKLHAWSYTNANRILFVDSDCVFSEKIDLVNSPYVRTDRPIVVYSPWHKVPGHVVQTPEGPKEASPQKWFEPTRQVLGFVPPVEAMRQAPYVYPGWFLHKLWEFLGGEDRLKTFEHPNEFNCMGNYAMAEYPEHFTFIEQFAPDCPPLQVANFWSHEYRLAGFKDPLEHPRIRAEMERLGLDK
jgi:hypothetical protein